MTATIGDVTAYSYVISREGKEHTNMDVTDPADARRLANSNPALLVTSVLTPNGVVRSRPWTSDSEDGWNLVVGEAANWIERVVRRYG